MKPKPRQTPKNGRNAKIVAKRKLRRKENKVRVKKFNKLVTEADKALMNSNHPDWVPGTTRLLTDLMKSEDEL